MKFTHSWLLEHLDTDKSPSEIADKLTSLGLEIEEFSNLGDAYEPFIVAEILEAEKHPNADKLQICKVNDGTQTLQIVCGAPNARAGIKVCLAPVGAYIPAADFKIKPAKIRDIESNGMLCSAAELGLGEDSAGIMEIDDSAEVGSKYAKYAGLDDSSYEIAITPNRQDCLGVRGIARDLAAAGYGTLHALDHPAGLANHSLNSPIQVESDNIYIGRYFKGVENKQSPAWLQHRLKSIGLEPISALVDITNFITFDLGRPLHVYDADKIKGNLKIRTAKAGEKINALNNKSYELTGIEPVIADDSGVVALGGVIGNEESSVDENTKNIFLEVAYFDPIEVANSGRKHQIDSDARYRFERGVDPDFLITGAAVATKLLLEICGGEPSELVTAGKESDWKHEIEFDFDLIKDLGGIDIPQKEAEEILEHLGFGINGNKITPPSWRRDIEAQPDLVEEIIRVVGLDKIEPQVLRFSTPEKLPLKASRKNVARSALATRGLTEIVSYSFMSKSSAELFGGGADNLRLQYPISEELSDMRPAILPNLIDAAVRNANRGAKTLGFFEVGPIFTQNKESKEQIIASGIRFGKNSDKGIYGKPRDYDAMDAKADILAALKELGAPANLQIREDAPAYYHPGRSAGFYLGKNCLGYFGEIHPRILKKLDCEEACVGFEIFLDNVPASRKKYKALQVSDFQAVSRDFAFIVPAETKSGEITRRVEKLDDLIVGSRVFDVFEGGNIEADKKSVAFSVDIQPKDKTLTDAEIEAISKKVMDCIEQNFSGTLRG